MAMIIYFGTHGCAGHAPKGIDAELTKDERDYYWKIDCEKWINYVYQHPGYSQFEDGNGVPAFALMAYPWSVDDERGGSHTNLIWWGRHSEEEVISLIKSNPFLAHQFKLD